MVIFSKKNLLSIAVITLAFSSVGVCAGGALKEAKNTPLISTKKLKILSANLGNVDIVKCGGDFIYKLCREPVEKEVIKSLEKINADIYLLQEVLRETQCTTKNKFLIGTVCHEKFLNTATSKNQIDRLLPDGYRIKCLEDQYECIAIRKKSGWKFAGELNLIPFGPGCETGFSISWIRAKLGKKLVTLVNGHPDSSSVVCRETSLKNLFNSLKGQSNPIVMGGDWNLDPFGAGEKKSGKVPTYDASELLWQNQIGPGKQFKYLSEDGKEPLVFTHPAGVLDHVVASKEISGTCKTLDGKIAPALDGSHRQLDHFGLLCQIDTSF